MMATTDKKRNPQDTTLRNLRALKKSVAAIEGTVAHLQRALAQLRARIVVLEKASLAYQLMTSGTQQGE